MLIKGEEKKGFSGKSAGDQRRFFKVVEFGSRPAKRARLDFLEASDGDADDEPMSEGNSGVTHELRSGLKVIISSEHMEERRSTHVLGQDKIDLDVDDTISTSDDDRLFVIQVRSPKSRQLLHEKQEDGRKTKVDSEEADSSAQVSKLGTYSKYDPRPEELSRIRSDGDAATKSEMLIPEAECCGEPGVNLKRTQAPATGAAENDGSGGDAALHLESDDALGERMIKHYVRRPHSRADSLDMIEKSDPGVNMSEVSKVYVRMRKQGSAAAELHDGSEDPSHVEGGDPLGESIIKHYVRRPHSRAISHGPDQSSSGLVMMTSSATNVSACSPQAEHPKETRPPRVETEGILSVFQRRSKTYQDLQRKEDSLIALQKKLPVKRSAEPRYVRADRQPRWLPEGWTLQIRIREGKKTPARIRDKYYHDQKTGHRFRSRNEVLQFLDCERLSKDGTAQLQDENHSLPLPTSPEFRSPPSKSPTIIPAMPPCAVSTEAFRADMSWGHVEGPNGPIQFPWGPHGQGGQANFDGGTRMSKLREEERLPTASPVPLPEPPGDHGEKENRGKLILRLKRKQPDSDAGKGKSKRPTYEVVHVERPPSPPPPPEPVRDITYEARRPYISSHWGMDRHAPHHQHLDVVQTPYTALGIPATAHTSGLQTMATYSANHTHVFLDPIENTIPLSWQFGPFSSTYSISTTGPSFRPSTSTLFSYSENRSSSILLPCSENRSSALLPCSENKSRDSLSDVDAGDNGPQRARLLTKGENSRLLVGLGRRLCQAAGVELEGGRDWSSSRSRKIGV